VVVARTKLYGRDAKRTLWAMNNQAITLNSIGRLSEARAIYESIVQAKTTPDSAGMQRSAHNNLIGVLERMGDVNEALRLAQLHCADLEARRGAAHIDTLQAQNNLAGLLGRVGGLSRLNVNVGR
jgi:urocanate hydratase